MKFEFKMMHDESEGLRPKEIIFKIEDEFLSDVVSEFSFFLKACGYHFGSLEIEND